MACFLAVGIWTFATYWAPIALADKRICTKEEAQSAEALAATANSWAQLHQQFERFAHCDDGAIAEGFSESVSLLLAEQWGNIRQLMVIIRFDPSFREFVIGHIDETIPEARLESIRGNAGKQCPHNLEILCHDFDIRAAQALHHVQ